MQSAGTKAQTKKIQILIVMPTAAGYFQLSVRIYCKFIINSLVAGYAVRAT